MIHPHDESLFIGEDHAAFGVLCDRGEFLAIGLALDRGWVRTEQGLKNFATWAD